MDHRIISRQFISAGNNLPDQAFNATGSRHDRGQRNFFHFVDKNPLFPDNSRETVNAFILASSKRRSRIAYNLQADDRDNTELWTNRLDHFRK
ncbi:MAG: hypothetical protein R6W75_10725 [Smithellaceae bacterium]